MTPAASGTWLTPKITVIDSGSAIEKPMNEPKVTMYSSVSDQVCLLLKMANCLAMFLHLAEGGQLHHQQRGDDDQRHRHPHVEQAQAGGRRAGTDTGPCRTDRAGDAPQVILANAAIGCRRSWATPS
jgi:hypothetical protein